MPVVSKMNETYFRVWSDNMAYILGFIVADGCIVCHDGTYQLIIVSKDVDVLEFIRDELEYQPSIKSCNDGCYRLTICRKSIVMDLMAHGVLPRKSWSPLVPDIPSEYHIPFIHGLFDGDGSVYISVQSKGSPALGSSIYSYSKGFLQTIGDMIKNQIGAIPKIYSPSRGNSAYRLMYARKESLGLYHMLYDTRTSDYYMGRKKSVFEKWLVDTKGDLNWALTSCKICGNRFVQFHDRSYRCWDCRRTKI